MNCADSDGRSPLHCSEQSKTLDEGVVLDEGEEAARGGGGGGGEGVSKAHVIKRL